MEKFRKKHSKAENSRKRTYSKLDMLNPFCWEIGVFAHVFITSLALGQSLRDFCSVYICSFPPPWWRVLAGSRASAASMHNKGSVANRKKTITIASAVFAITNSLERLAKKR